MDQQHQTKEYFEKFAQDWQAKAQNSGRNYNLVEARNNTVLMSMGQARSARKLLDVGCGTGQLVIEAAKRGVEAVGIDFANDMIEQCEINRKAAGVQATFITASFFDVPAPSERFDVISALGFIEYISADQLEEFFATCFDWLRPGGLLIFGSRNRLFNAVSLNEFTRIEMALGVLDDLIAEAITLNQSNSQVAALASLHQHERLYPQPETHPTTGVRVDIRYQYSPAELIKRLRGHRFLPQTLYPIHFHGLPASMNADHPKLHSELAMLAERVAPLDPRLVPHCSTFVLAAIRS